jgi:hypothetical protein
LEAKACPCQRSAVWRRRPHGRLYQPPEHTREQISARIKQLLENPRQRRDNYDQLTDQWITTYGGGAGLIVTRVV